MKMLELRFMWSLLENIFVCSRFKRAWEEGTHQMEFECKNCRKIVEIGQKNEISYKSKACMIGWVYL